MIKAFIRCCKNKIRFYVQKRLLFSQELFYVKKNLSDPFILSKSKSLSISNCNLFVKSKLKIPDKDFASIIYFFDFKRHSDLHCVIISVNFFILSSEFNFMIKLFIFLHLHIYCAKKLF